MLLLQGAGSAGVCSWGGDAAEPGNCNHAILGDEAVGAVVEAVGESVGASRHFEIASSLQTNSFMNGLVVSGALSIK